MTLRSSDRTGLAEFVSALKEKKRDAVFLGGGLREGAGFNDFREEVIKTAKVILPLLLIPLWFLMRDSGGYAWYKNCASQFRERTPKHR
jgi:hypothetical protein